MGLVSRSLVNIVPGWIARVGLVACLTASSAMAAEPGVPLEGVMAFDSSVAVRLSSPDSVHRCASVGERVWCWGDNAQGQLGTGGMAGIDFATPVIGLVGEVAHVATGALHSCAVVDRRLFCWGDNSSGQLGTGDMDGRNVPTRVLPALEFRAVDAGGDHTCASTVDDRLLCWGDNRFGEVGVAPSGEPVTEPVEVMRRPGLELALGGSHSCVLSDGAVECWGWNRDGQLGDGTFESRPMPAAVVDLPSGIIDVASAGDHSCASDGIDVWCWGSNREAKTGRAYESGDESTWSTPHPHRVDGLAGSVGDVALGTNRSCAVVGDAMQCWGQVEPWPAEPVADAVEAWRAEGPIRSSEEPDCALVDERVVCVNGSGRGQVRSPFRAARVAGLRPLSLDSAERARLIVGAGNACAQYGDRDLRCWGGNGFGQLGQGHDDRVGGAVPVAFPGDPVVHDVALGVFHACAVTSDGLFCWGNNFFRQLGLPGDGDRLEPTAVPIDVDSATRIAAGFEFTCLWSAGAESMRCFGRIPGGTAADHDPAPPEQPRTVPLESGMLRDVSVGRDQACVLLDTAGESTVRCWGRLKTEPDYDGRRSLRDVDTGLADIQRLSARGFSHCAHSATDVACWGLDHTWKELPRGPNRAPFLVQLPHGAAFEDRSDAFAVGGRHACVAGRNGETACIGLPLVQACSFREATGDLGGGSGVAGCFDVEFTDLTDDDLGWLPISGLPSIEADAIASGDEFTCARVGRWIRCWGRGSGRGLAPAPDPHTPAAPVQRAGVIEPSESVPIEFDATSNCPAFLVTRVSLLEPDGDRTAGAWGTEVYLREGRTRLHGGLHFGGYANADAGVSGFAAFRIDNDDGSAQRVDLMLRGDGDRFRVEVFSSVPGTGIRDRVFEDTLTFTEQSSQRPLMLDEGFHVVRVTPVDSGGEPALFNVSAETEALDGGPASFRYGAVVGGYLERSLPGYTALCTDDARVFEVRTQAANDRGLIGAGDLRLEIENRTLGEILYDSLDEPLPQ